MALKPTALTMEEAASIPLVGLTTWQALIEKGQLRKGQQVLVHAGSGGVGTVAIQLAKHVGATVATTTSARNIALVKRLGADIVIDYTKDDFAAILKDYDVVLDTQGGNALEKSLRVLKPGGKLIGIAGLIDAGAIRPVIDRVFPFASTKEALAYLETGRAKGKVVIRIR